MSLFGRDTGDAGEGDVPRSAAEELRSSARGWHGAQLAVLGFIGLCGVLQGDSGADNPVWLETLAGLLVLGALATAVLGTALVASVAWPVTPPDEWRQASARRRLVGGVALTYLAVVLMALGATSAWWPHDGSGAAGSDLVRLRTSAGTACGELAPSSQDGVLTVVVRGQQVSVAADNVLGLEPVSAC